MSPRRLLTLGGLSIDWRMKGESASTDRKLYNPLARESEVDFNSEAAWPFYSAMEAIMAATEGNGFSVSAEPAQLRQASSAYLRCPNCNSTDLKKVSLAYQEGRFYTDVQTRLSAVVAGGTGPDLVIGKATTRGFHQSVLSKQLSPPARWSYRKLVRWWALVFLSIGWIVFYMNTITKNSAAVLSPPLTLFALLSAATFLVLLVLFWRHNQTTHRRRYSQWERSFLCQRCGTLTEQE